ncbi:MAG: hypothetical protein M1115_02915 [Actinobacteria bacterium]|nr:hypothetical protein [Actinomycetota bacterium]
MAFQIETKDCTSLSDSELSELADLCMEGRGGFDIGYLSKQREEWVLVTQVREGAKLRGFSFSTLERIGGTPSILLGLAQMTRTSKADATLKAIMGEQFRRALLAFPDEDVLVGVRIVDPVGFQVLSGLSEVVPRPGHRATGEERAWGRRLAKRFKAEGQIDDRSFVLTGDGSTFGFVDFVSSRTDTVEPEVEAFFGSIDCGRGDCLVAFGWAMAEDLAAGRLP